MTAERTVTVEKRPARLDLGEIPEEVIEHYAGKGQHLRLQHTSEQSVLQMAQMQAYPLLSSETSEDLLPVLKRHAFKIQPDGTITRGDTMIFVQEETVRQMVNEEAEEQFRRQLDSHYHEVDEANALAQRTGGMEVRRRGNTRVTDHIHRGK